MKGYNNYLLTTDSYVPLYNRFHRGEWITSAAVLEAEVSTAALVAAHPTAADDAALSTTPAAGRRLPPSPSRSGSPSSASDMSRAENGGSETDGFHKPRRRRKRSPQTGSPGSMSPDQKTSKKEPG